MNQKNQNIDKLTSELLQKSLLKPSSPGFDDELMKKIQLSAPPLKLRSNGNSIKKAWVFMLLAVFFFLGLAFLLGEFSGGYFKEFSTLMNATANYVFYGGMALFIPLVLYHFDALVQTMILKKRDHLTYT